MVAGTLMAIAFMGIVQMNINNQKTQRTSEINFEINSIINSTTKILSNPDSCMQTFLGLGKITDKMKIPLIKNHRGVKTLEINQKYGNNLLKITEILIGELDLNSSSGKKTGSFNFHVNFEKLGSGFYGTKTITKTIPFELETDLDDNLIKCNSKKRTSK